MIQDIAPHKLGNQYDPAAVPEQEDYALCFDNGRVLLRTGETARLLRIKDFPEECRFVYLFTVDDCRFFLLSGEAFTPDGCDFVDIRTLRGSKQLPREILLPFSPENTWRTGTGTPGSAAAAENRCAIPPRNGR